MKILESYLGIAKSLFMEAEIDDEEMIKYKDKEGESKEMKAGSAKTMDKEHPAKIEYDRMVDKGGEEEPKGKALGKGDFERDFDDEEPEDGQKYRPIKDSVEPKKHILREMYEKIGGK